MPRIVESKTCPTCGHDKGTVQKFDIPEIPVLDSETLKSLQATSASKDDIKSILVKLDDLRVPAVIHSTCEEHPELCKHKAALDATKEQLAEITKVAQHPALTIEYLESQYGSCPNCTSAIDGLIAKKGFVKKADPNPEPPKSKEPEYITPWGR